MLTQEELKSFAHYDPETGIMTKTRKLGQRCKIGSQIGYKDAGCGTLIYLATEYKGKKHKIHRLAWLYMTGEWPQAEIDHINGDGLDNRWCNLRVVDRAANQRNRKMHVNNKSGKLGVCWQPSRSQWIVTIGIGGKNKTIGRFYDLQDAIKAREQAERDYGYHENHGQPRRVA